jgi:serine/threonine-protein kinase
MSAAASPDHVPSPAGDFCAFPRTFGPYILLSSLARGGMGEVFLAKHGLAGLERMCVIKSIRSNLMGDAEYVRRFIDEARTVVQLAHRNICSVLDVGAVDGQYYLSMELICGRDARTIAERARVQQLKIPAQLALHVVGEMLEALDYAHRLVDTRTDEPFGIVHRDVSPQNVMVSFEGEVKLIDFGLAVSKDKLERTAPGIVLGKLQYMSPEQARGHAIGPFTDVFSTGVLLYELLTGERYYEGLSIDDVWQRVGAGTHVPVRLNALPEETREVLRRALAADAAARFQTAGDFRAALHQVQVRTQHIGSAGELRTFMATLFPGEEVNDRRARAVLAAAPIRDVSSEVTRVVRFAAAPSSEAEPGTARAPVATSPTDAVLTMRDVESLPARTPNDRTVVVRSRSTPVASARGSPRILIAAALSAALAAGALTLLLSSHSTAPDAPPPTPKRAAAVEPVVRVNDVAPPIDVMVHANDAAAAALPAGRRTPKRADKGTVRTVKKQKPAPAVELPEPPPTLFGRVKYLADHCASLPCAQPLVERQKLRDGMTVDELREHKDAVERCVASCRASPRR